MRGSPIDMLILCCRILTSISRFMDSVCIDPLMPTVMMIGHFILVGFVIYYSIAYLFNILVVSSSGHLCLQYVKMRICILRLGLGVNGVLPYGGAPRMSKRSLGKHLHFGR